MDQVAAAGVQLLAAYKKQLDAAKEKVDVARRLATKVEIFEVTITMIPRRGSTEHFKGEPEETKAAEEGKPQTNKEKVQNYANEASAFAVETVTSMVMDKAKEVLDQTPFGLVADLISFGSGDDQSPIMKDMRAGEILNMMRKNGAKDLEVSFAAMRFIVQSALTIIDDAVKDVKLIEIPNCCWVIQPWKVQAQNVVGERLDGHLDALDKFNGQLQSAIAVASYCISLEQLENVLNATSMLACMELREFWKRKIGIGNIRAKMNEVVESFLDEVLDNIGKYHKEHCHVVEKFVKLKTTPEVALGRFLSNLWNTNGDTFITVYELNANTQLYASKFGKDCQVITITTQIIIALEKLFYSKIMFYPISIDSGKDKIQGTADDKLVLYDSQKLHENHRVELHPNDMMIVLQPFQRLRIMCTLPNFDTDMYPYDCVALMKYEKVNSLPQLVTAAEYLLEEVSGSRTFLNPDTNEQLYGKDVYKWNAPKTFKNKDAQTGKEKTFKVPGMDGKRIGPSNFEVTRTNVSTAQEGDAEEDNFNASNAASNNAASNTVLDSSNVTLDKGGITTTTSILYTPVVSDPGFYTIRLVLDDLELDDHEDIRFVNKKKLLISNKSYYYNRSVEVSATFNESTNRGKAFYTKEGLGEDSIVLYYQLALQILICDEIEARRIRDFSKFAQIQRDRNKIELALSKLTNTVNTAIANSGNGTAAEVAEGKIVRVDDADNVVKSPPPAAAAAAAAASASPATPTASGGGVLSSISSFFSSANTANNTAANSTTAVTRNDGIMMMSNPLATRKSITATSKLTESPANTAGSDAKSTHTRISILLKDLSKSGPATDKDYQGYLSTVTKALPSSVSNTDLVQSRVLEKTEIALKRLHLALQLRAVIDKVSLYIDSLQDQWFDSMLQLQASTKLVGNGSKAKTGDNELLKQVDESLRQYRGLLQIHRSLLPTELQNSLSVTSTTSSKYHLPTTAVKTAKDNESRYLVDFAADRTHIAKNCLEHLFAQYYIVKMSVYELDSKESMWQRNVRRLELLTSKMTDLRQAILEDSAAKTTAATSAANPATGNSSTVPAKRRGSATALESSNATVLTAEQIFHKHTAHRVAHPVTLRSDILFHIDSLIVEIEQHIDHLFNEASDPKKKGQMHLLVKRAEQCDQVITELKAIRELAAYLPPSSSPTAEEELQFSRHSTKPPLGLIIQVEDAHAIAWGEAERNLSDDEYESDGEAEGKEKTKTKYRPVIEYNYPYHAKTTVRTNVANVDFSIPAQTVAAADQHGGAHNIPKLETAVFFNIASTTSTNNNSNNNNNSNAAAAKKKKDNDESDKKDSKPAPLIPTHIAIFTKQEAYQDSTHPQHLELLDCVEIENKNDRYCMVDFYASVREVVGRVAPDFDFETVSVDLDLKVVLVAQVPASQLEAVNEEKLQTWKLPNNSSSGAAADGNNEKLYAFVEDSAMLTYNIYEDAAYDSDDDEEEEYDYDEDEDEDDDEDNEDYELEVAYDKAADVERVLSKLHKFHLDCHQNCANHILALCDTEELYEGSMYIYCDVCEGRVHGHIYHCLDCGNYDAHPQCVLEHFYELAEASDVVQSYPDDVDPMQLDKKTLPGYVDEAAYLSQLEQQAHSEQDEGGGQAESDNDEEGEEEGSEAGSGQGAEEEEEGSDDEE